MLTLKIYVGDEIRKAIKDTYGKDDYVTINSVVNDVVGRYLDVEYFDPKLSMDEDAQHKICEVCGEKSKINKMVDVDRKNIEEHEVCENCGAAYPGLR